jgi:coenzyme PQQ precursor peptide PqqA
MPDAGWHRKYATRYEAGKTIRKEVKVVEEITMEWETPEFEEIGTSAEVTAYAGIWPDSE